jgi:N-acetylmuramoyl-L-alanine amidase
MIKSPLFSAQRPGARRGKSASGPALILLGIGLLLALGPAIPTGAGETPATRQRKPVSQPTPPTLSAPAQILEARSLLGELGYWVKLDVETFDDSLKHALIAFQKVEGRERTGKLTKDELSALLTARRPTPREIGKPHIEVDIQKQVLMVVDCCGAVLRTLSISSGTGKPFTEGERTRMACTPCGRFTVFRKIRGWHTSPLGRLYYPSFIKGGVAIHGSTSVPATPASHGCIRVPMFAAKELYDMMPIGTEVLVFDD